MAAMPHQEPKAGLRRGPRPLLLHLALAALKQSGMGAAKPNASGFASSNSNADWQSWMAQQQLSALAGKPPQNGPDAALLHGIAAYRRHPYARDLTDPPPVWQEGETCLRYYGGPSEAGEAPPMLLIPSLVNRATILDLASGRSLARALVGHGLRVFLLDWGWPDAEARKLDLDGLITGRLSRAMAQIGRVTLVGYCMGGLLALAAALREPERVAGLGLLATPWDFHIGRDQAALRMAQHLETLEPVMQLTGTLPVDALQMLFNLAEPHAVGDKYRDFGTTDQSSERARNFVAFEDWLNDGVPLAAPVARQTLGEWFGENRPARGLWQIAGQVVDPSKLRVPSLVALAQRDRIVPPESGLPLATCLPGCTLLRPDAGHVGMIAGSTAETALWGPLAQWALGIKTIPGFAKPKQAAKVRRRRGDTAKEKPE